MTGHAVLDSHVHRSRCRAQHMTCHAAFESNFCCTNTEEGALCRIDNDAVLMRDVYPITMLVGYQFCMRWTNAHVFYVTKGSLLAKRILDITRTMPLNHPEFVETIVDKVLILTFGYSADTHSLLLSQQGCPLILVEHLTIHCRTGPAPKDKNAWRAVQSAWP